jgi:hypothetical protein
VAVGAPLLYKCAVRFIAVAALSVVLGMPAFAQRLTPAPPQPPPAPGVIAGRVTASGAAAVGALVTVLRESVPVGTDLPRLGARNVRLFALTNQRGEYRLTNVPEGQYLVVALPRMLPVAPADRRGHAVTYYPGALESSEAREVIVRGREPIEVNIRLIPARVSVISGVAIGSNGRPLSSGIIQLGFGAPLFGVGSTTLPISRDGSFTTPALPRGVYSLQTTDGQGSRAMSQVPNPVMSGARVTVAEADVTGVHLEPIRRVTVHGRVRAPRGVSVQGLAVSALPLVNEGPAGPNGAGNVAADGTFEFQVWPRRSIVRVSNVVNTPAGSRGLELRPLPVVRLNGADVTRTGIDIQPGRDIRGLEIELGR